MRLTEKDEEYIGGYCSIGNPNTKWKEKAYSKLGQVEDIEEKHNINSIEDLNNRLTILEIIKKKKVWVAYFLKCNSAEEYNHGLFDFGKENYLTQEEFDLLKEELL